MLESHYKMQKLFTKQNMFLFSIIILGLSLRLFGLNWDQNQHLHPDERFLTMVLERIEIPASFSSYLNSHTSLFNPHNHGFAFFVYGTFPLFLNKFLAVAFKMDSYHGYAILGRIISAFFDTGVIILVFLIGKKLYPKQKSLPLWAAFFYAVAVLPIQLAHFYTVDPFLNFFLAGSFLSLIVLVQRSNGAVRFPVWPPAILGLCFGLALACKVSALLFAPLVGATFLYLAKRDLKKTCLQVSIFILVGFLVFRVTQPYAFDTNNLLNPSLNTAFINDLRELRGHSNPDSTPPPGVQWIKTTPILFPLVNMLSWGLGLPIGILSLIGFAYAAYGLAKGNSDFGVFLMLFWVSLLVAYQGTQFVKTMRYFLPLYPYLCLLAAYLILSVKLKHRTFCSGSVMLIVLVWPISFISIYTHRHSRISASEWIYENIPAGSYLVNEHWDDALPLSLGGHNRRNYTIKQLPFYDRDTRDKWVKITTELEKADYIIITSSRLYDSIPYDKERYPVTSRYYQLLFSGNLGFIPTYVQTSYPKLSLPFLNKCLTIKIPQNTSLDETKIFNLGNQNACENFSGIVINDDASEEAFTVHDHPKVIIFERKSEISSQELLGLLLTEEDKR